MTAAGFDNLAARRGIVSVGYLTLERVIAARPDALIVGRLSVDFPSLAARSLDHPALARAVPEGAMISLPHRPRSARRFLQAACGLCLPTVQ